MAEKKTPLRQIQPVTIHCAVCLQQGKNEPAFTVINSYACCQRHVPLVSKPTFNIFQLQTDGGAV